MLIFDFVAHEYDICDADLHLILSKSLKSK